MDFLKAQRLLLKIQTFIDQENGHSLSRLEADLLKTYIQQLYEEVVSDTPASPSTSVPPTSRHAMPESKPTPQPPPVEETWAPVEEAPPSHQPQVEHTEIIYEKPQAQPAPPPPPPVVVRKPEPVYEAIPEPEPAPAPIAAPEPVQVTVETKVQVNTDPDTQESLSKLFDLPTVDEMSGRFNQVTIPSIESAMGLNERIFTLNELFGGDKSLFDSTCASLNTLTTFHEARELLVQGPAQQFKWAEPQRIKMAEQFLRIVARRYPRS